MNLDNVKIVNQDGFSEDMQKEAICIAKQALELFNNEKEMGQYIKREIETKFGGKWCSFVGFCCFPPFHDISPFIYFWIDKCKFIIFSTKPEWFKI